MKAKMLALFALLGIFTLSFAKPTIDEAEFTNFRKHWRIVGGEEASRHEFPWIVDVLVENRHLCAGSIINNQWIVTAAHCATSAPSSYTLVAGEHNRNASEGTEQTASVQLVIVHPNYEGPGAIEFENDIALMKVSPPFQFNLYVQPAALPPFGFNPPQNTTVAGWGTLQEDGTSPSNLYKVVVPFVNDNACRTAYGPGLIADSMMCAGQGGKDACQGDSGGPLMCAYGSIQFVCGLVSWGNGCGRPEFPGVYTELSHFGQWVSEIIHAPEEDNSTWVEQNEGCGGVLVGSSGRVSYHLGEAYANNERCTWTLRANNKERIRLEFKAEGFAAGDYIAVTETNFETGEVVRTSRLNGTGVYTFSGPVIFVTFHSDAQGSGNGFSFDWYGTGYNSPFGLNFRHYHLPNVTGTFSYPASGQYGNLDYVTISVNPLATNATLNFTRMELESGSSCNYDSVNIHTYSSTGYNFRSKHCGTTVPPGYTSDGLYLIIFLSDSSVTDNGFSFTWN